MFEPVKLNNLYNIPGAKKDSKRVGRGIGSGKGKTCGRGVKGQKSRKGVAIKGFEGGQMPIIKRLPKRGFNPLNPEKYSVVNIEEINNLIDAKVIKPDTTIDSELLISLGVVSSKRDPIKLLGSDKLSVKVNFALDAYSAAAKKQIELIGGEIKNNN